MNASSEETAFLGLHAAWFSVSVLTTALLYLRPKPRVALLGLVLMHSLAFLGYYGSVPRTYAVGVSSDRALGVGMAMAVAAGGSPFDHVQVEFGNLEPLWTFTVAALSLFTIDLVPFVYDRMAILVMTLTALGFYGAWSAAQNGEDAGRARWRGVLVAAAALGLSSFAISPDPPIQHFWQANFVFKPNHALAFGLVGLLSRFSPARRSWLFLGALLAILMWAFILDWAYLLPGLFLAAVMGGDRLTGLKRVVGGTTLSLVFGSPYLIHLLRDYNPLGQGEMPQIWRDQMGDRLTSPCLWSLDLGPTLILFAVGLGFALARRRTESGALGFLLTGPLVAICYLVGLQLGLAPEPDEGFYYWRLVAGAGAGYALWSLATISFSKTPLASASASPSLADAAATKRFVLAFGVILISSYPAYFNPLRDDRYFARGNTPLPGRVLSIADWIRNNTSPESVLISSEGIMFSGLTGRKFLMVRPDQTRDRVERENAERDILTSLDETTVRRAAKRYRVTHVILDEGLRQRYGEAARGLGNRPWFEPALVNSFARVMILKNGGGPPPSSEPGGGA